MCERYGIVEGWWILGMDVFIFCIFAQLFDDSFLQFFSSDKQIQAFS